MSRIVFEFTLYFWASAMLVAVKLWLPMVFLHSKISMACSFVKIALGRSSDFSPDIDMSEIFAELPRFGRKKNEMEEIKIEPCLRSVPAKSIDRKPNVHFIGERNPSKT
jgi:hypothetical protein